jgi:hypothetical protein
MMSPVALVNSAVSDCVSDNAVLAILFSPFILCYIFVSEMLYIETKTKDF